MLVVALAKMNWTSSDVEVVGVAAGTGRAGADKQLRAHRIVRRAREGPVRELGAFGVVRCRPSVPFSDGSCPVVLDQLLL